MNYYAIKTNKGFLATQGQESWFQETPQGWAEFTSEESARDIAEAHHSMIGTADNEGFEIIELT